MKTNRRFFYVMWWQEVLFIIVPIIVIMSVSTIISKSLKDNTIKQHETTTAYAINSIEAKFDSMGYVSYQILNSDPIKEIINLEKANTARFYHKVRQISAEFAKYKNTIDYENIILYFGKNDVAISGNSLCTDANKYYGKIFQYNNIKYSEFKKHLYDTKSEDNTKAAGTIKLGLDSYNGIIFTYRFKVPNDETATTLLFLTVENDYIDSLFKPLTDQESYIYITDSGGQIVYQNTEDLSNILEHKTFKKLQDKFIITNSTSSSGFTFHCLTPKSVVLNKVTLLNITSIVLSMLAIIFTLILFAFKCIKNSKLVNNIATASGIEIWNKKQNIFETIYDAMDTIVRDNEHLAIYVDTTQKTLQKEFFIHLFITGFNYGNDVAFYSQNANIDINNGKYYLIFISAYYNKDDIFIDDITNLKSTNIAVAEKIENYIGNIGHVIWNGCEELIVILNAQICGEFSELLEHITTISSMYYSQQYVLSSVCTSEQSYEIDKLREVYFGCAKTVYNLYVKNHLVGNDEICLYNPESLKGKSIDVSFTKQAQMLIDFCINGNSNQAIQILKDMFSQTATQNSINNNMKSAFINVCKDMFVKVTLDKQYKLGKIFECINSLNLSNVLLKFLSTYLNEICSNNIAFAQDANVNNQLHARIISYIDENLSNQDLSLKTASMEFNFAPTYFSALFKETMGDTFSGYLDNKRMSLAKELLSNESNRVEDVGTMCGYSSVTSFRRAFKKYYGVSPSHIKEFI